MQTEHKEYLKQEFERLSKRVEILENAMIFLVNSIDEKDQKSLKQKIKKS